MAYFSRKAKEKEIEIAKREIISELADLLDKGRTIDVRDVVRLRDEFGILSGCPTDNGYISRAYFEFTGRLIKRVREVRPIYLKYHPN